MLKYRTTFVRSLILIWLATWILADPLALIQGLMAPQEYSAAYNVLRNGPFGKHFAPHYLDARISSSTEGNPNRSEDIQSDESGSGSCVDQRRFSHPQLVALTVACQPWFPFSTSAAPRAPPSASL